MMQQVNLFQPMFRQQKKIFSAATMLQIVLFFAVVLGAVYAYTLTRLEPFRNELARVEGEFEKLTRQIELHRARFPTREKSKLLEQEVERLSVEVAFQRRLKEALSSGSFGNAAGFSDHFEALARGHVEGSWLTRILLANGGANVSLSGKTVDPELVPVYIRRLAESPEFSKRAFNVLELARSQKEVNLVEFNIATGG